MKKLIFRETGSIAALAALSAAAIVIFIFFLSNLTRSHVKQTDYLKQMERTLRLAETGMNNSLGRILINPELIGGGPINETIDDGQSETVAYERINALGPSTYLITTSTRNVAGKRFITRLHTYARISNTGEYFSAVNSEITITTSVMAASGRVYAPSITFQHDSSKPPTELRSAQFVNTVTPPVGDPAYGMSAEIRISEDGHQPKILAVPILFPQILDSDMDRFRTLAHMAGTPHRECDFSRPAYRSPNGLIHIFPPGYDGASGIYDDSANGIEDQYAGHTNAFADHVYYCDEPIGGMKVEGIIHGQILFVSEGPISISSSIISADEYYASKGIAGDPFLEYQGGALNISSSTANQAILITRSDVFITSTFWTGPPPVSVTTQTIQALIMAPHGTVSAVAYPAGMGVMERLRLKFSGSLILQDQPQNFPTVFAAGRQYGYMTTLTTNPPPYVPALASILASFEEIIGHE
jgi:hypothetical protein